MVAISLGHEDHVLGFFIDFFHKSFKLTITNGLS